MEFFDTHCHIHDSSFAEKFGREISLIIADAELSGVKTMMCVGTDVSSSIEAIEFCKRHKQCHPTIALHPHEAANKNVDTLKKEFSEIDKLAKQHTPVAIGECGLDYFYHSSDDTRIKQQEVFRWHIELALRYKLPIIFHIRDAFDDFFKIIDEYEGIMGVVHSFSAGPIELQGCIERNLFIGLNGIMTFTKQAEQLNAARAVPLENLLIETDAPFLTPVPFRGTINEPKHVIKITQFLSELRGESQALLAEKTTKNAKKLFKL